MLLRFLCEKLVRDKTEVRYLAEGGALESRTLNDAEFKRELHKKLLEEANEAIEAQDRDELVAELADVEEILRTIAEFNSITLEEIEASRLQKLAQRGGFSKRLYTSIAAIPEDAPFAAYLLTKPQHYLLQQEETLPRELEANTGAWKRFFGELKNDIMLTMPEYVISALHIGTTSLKDIPAQPIVDILMAVTSLLDFDLNSHSLMRHGWLAKGERGINNRRMFVKLDTHNGTEVAHLHCFEYTDPNVKNFVRFSHMLKENVELRVEYTECRQNLLKNSATTRASYQTGKKTFIEKTLA